ncbi:MAG: DUF2269 domain-containing protein [Actinobacteria bacterium]|nr:DUF2269 domain-containing protein [Actinomycetota bacterium]
MSMPPALRKAVLAAHLTVSVGWVGGVLAYLALGLAAVASPDDEVTRAAWIAMDLIGWYAIVPVAVMSWGTGIAMALGTPWGLFRHYWVVVSLILTTGALIVLVLHMPTVTATADLARTASSARLDSLGGDLAHPAVGLLVLLVVEVLNIYKPRGLTRYGVARQRRGAD